jgi:hypothetical protein
MVLNDKITVLIPTSPIPSHPDTYKIDQVIASIRHHLPTSEIVVMCDGPRPSVEHRRAHYEEYKSRLLWKAQNDPSWHNVQIVIYEEAGENHKHQTGIVRETILRGLVKTPLILFNEHDAPLVTDPDRPIDWNRIVNVLETEQARIVRFYYFEKLIPEHAHMFHGSFRHDTVEYVRTTQYSGWPHVTTKDNMMNLLSHHTPFRGKETMLETAFYSPVAISPWDQYRVVIYAPDGNMQRFVHTNGRGEGAERDAVDW